MESEAGQEKKDFCFFLFLKVYIFRYKRGGEQKKHCNLNHLASSSKEAKTMWHGVSQTGDYKRILSTTLLFFFYGCVSIIIISSGLLTLLRVLEASIIFSSQFLLLDYY